MKKTLIFSAALVLSLGLAGCGADSSKEEKPKEETQTTASTGEKGTAKEEKKEDDKALKSGTYKVGTDLKAGEYLVKTDSPIGYIEVAKDSTGALGSIIFNATPTQGSHIYVTVQDGQYFKVDGSKFYSVADAPSVIPQDGIYKDGQFKVGTDIPAGEYKYVLDSESGIGYIEVSKNSSHDIGTIVTNETPQADGYITVTDGQYLTLQDVYIKTK